MYMSLLVALPYLFAIIWLHDYHKKYGLKILKHQNFYKNSIDSIK